MCYVCIHIYIHIYIYIYEDVVNTGPGRVPFLLGENPSVRLTDMYIYIYIYIYHIDKHIHIHILHIYIYIYIYTCISDSGPGNIEIGKTGARPPEMIPG